MENIIVKKIKTLENKELNKISRWMYNWWGKEEGITLEGCKCYIKSHLQNKNIPTIFGLYKNEKIIGIYTITYQDLTVRPDIYPWLANVYIEKRERNKGYSKVLLYSVKENVLKISNFKEIFLYTKHKGLYEKYGWEFVEEIDTHIKGHRIQRLYKLNLDK